MKTEKNITELLGKIAFFNFDHVRENITKVELQTTSKNSLETVFGNSNRNPQVLRSLAQLYNHGNLGGPGYLRILPVDQGIEHDAAFSFYKNSDYFNLENIIKLAIEAACNAVASTFGVVGLNLRKYVHKIPFIVKFTQY